ncbi:MAG: phosphoribosylformylglycinamidine synthase II, partial [Actinobacteria bacterium]|nr:phosphoribosylformylglycinamidine synthase II [Actinomycetota bacterium]
GDTKNDLAGSEWAYMHDQRGGEAPIADLQKEMRLIDLLLEGQSIFVAAHDLSQGGLAVTLAEMVLHNNIGATLTLSGELGIALLSESPGRVVVAVSPADGANFAAMAKAHDISIVKIGSTGGDVLAINDAVIPLNELRTAHTQTIPKLFG